MRLGRLVALACVSAAFAGCVATPIQLPGPQLGTDGTRGGDLWQAGGVDAGLSDHLPTPPPADDSATNLKRDLDYHGKSDAGAAALADAVPSELGPATDGSPSELGVATDAAPSELGPSPDLSPSDSAAAGEKGQGTDASKD